ncbi:oligosaccharyl transferase subunit ost3/OST6 [Coemansia sp. RSA 2611]|nr:oligosaccharyl transferase subunit ost3/OST6 [Coemansia sp. RSA 2611]
MTMRLLVVLALAALCLGQAFDQLQRLAQRDADGVAQLTLPQFMEHVVPEAKTYAVVVQLTALDPEYKCDTCRAVDRSVRAVARGWRRQTRARQIAFGTLDVAHGEELFRSMGIDKIPRLMIFPPGASPRELKLSARTSSAAGMAARLGELFGVEMQPDEPADYAKYAGGAAATLGGAYLGWVVVRRLSLRMLVRNAWAAGSIVFVLLMTSGLMWNRINAPPFMGQTRSGDAVLFAPTNSQQFGVEPQIVASAYAACALCVVLLVRHVPRVPGDQRPLVTVAVLAALVLVYSYLNSVFRQKMPAYPLRLLLP